MTTVADIAKERLAYVDEAIVAAGRAGLPLYVAFALMDMESEGENVYGGDKGGYFSQSPRKKVTEENFADFYETVVVDGHKSNGVGPLQITYNGRVVNGKRVGSFFMDAKSKGLELWKPVDNLTYGFMLLADYAEQFDNDWFRVGKRYNGKDSYGTTFKRVVGEWKTRLDGADEEENVVAVGLSPDDVIKAFKKWGIKYEEISGWKTRNRNSSQGAFRPNGVMVHHTAGSSDSADLRVLRDGRPGLPGPLSQFGIADDGTVWLIGNGVASHAGMGDQGVLDKVVAENYHGYESEIEPGGDDTSGNQEFYGIEIAYSGTRPPTATQRESAKLICVALCHAHGWTALSVIGHKEWTDRKIDPFGIKMNEFRQDVREALKGGDKPTPPPVDPPTPEPEPEKPMTEHEKIAEAVWNALAGVG